ncbi:MAG: hypothetical protein SGJ27_09890 [Candidatus Melainabacteria bacterium]|nr:hypothetical protein [Candidatus Melainabacteria bacterium]
MNPCFKARIQTAGARSLAVIATGVVSWYVAQPIAQYFEKSLSDPMQIGIGVVAALVALFVSKRALDFTEDCMTVPDAALARAAVGTERTCRKKSCHLRLDADGKPVPGSGKSDCANKSGSGKSDSTSDKTAGKSNTGCEAHDLARSALSTTVSDHPTIKVSVQADQGGTIVTVDITGVSAAKFKDKQSGLRKKLENIGGVKWENPRNLGDGNRQMVGRMLDTSRREAIVARLQGLASSL